MARSIREMEYVVFDVETTGLSVLGGDRIIEIAGMKIKDSKKIDDFHALINPERDIPPAASRVNGITSEMVEGAATASEALPKFLDFIGEACLVGHNIKFDLDFLCYQLALLGKRINTRVPTLDTLKMARTLAPGLQRYKLWFVAQSFGIEIGELHRAMADVELTAAVLNKLLELAEVDKVDDFDALHSQFTVQKPEFPIQDTQGTLF